MDIFAEHKWNLLFYIELLFITFNFNFLLVNTMLNEDSIQPLNLTPMPEITSNNLTNNNDSTEKPPILEEKCFYAEPELCNFEINIQNGINNLTNNQLCKLCRQYPTQLDPLKFSLVCCNITDINQVKNCTLNKKFQNIHIRNLTVTELSISSLNTFKESKSLAITDGNIMRITETFSLHSNLKCLNISNNNLTEFTDQRALTSLISKQLQILDLSHNCLSKIPITHSHKNLSLDIRDNKRMLCNSLNDAIEKGNAIFIDPNSTLCYLNQTYNWFNSTELVSISQLIRMRKLRIECPIISGHGNCTCNPERMLYSDVDDAQLIFTVKVDCSNMGLNKLPDKLPKNTISLNVSNNNISDFGNHFHSNSDYFSIIYLDADNNKISSIYELEGTKFIANFQQFNLRGNLLDKIPEYLLSNALDNNPKFRMLYLSKNKVTCDCNSAKVLKLWLLARQNNIPDYANILCNNMPQKVIELTEIKLCQSAHDWTDYIYYLIVSEVFLLIALIMKVSYDYYKFKTSGYLPWPASKMPKLPCDWLCES